MTEGTTIYPTHTCFDDAIEFLTEVVREKPARQHTLEFVLCHGVIRTTADGREVSHAWVEQLGIPPMVWAAGILNGEKVFFQITREEHYRESRARDVTCYSIQKAWKMNRKHGTYGPWEERYIVLTAKPGTYTGKQA